MTEAEWLACEDPRPMLEFLRGKVSERKTWLYTAAYLRKARDTTSRAGRHIVQETKAPDKLEKAIGVTERYADRDVSPKELGDAWTDWVFADPDADLIWWSLM